MSQDAALDHSAYTLFQVFMKEKSRAQQTTHALQHDQYLLNALHRGTFDIVDNVESEKCRW
jgi:hypothetical protein